MKQSFDEWFEQLKQVFADNGMSGAGEPDKEAFRCYFEDDYSPEDAFKEDIEYC